MNFNRNSLAINDWKKISCYMKNKKYKVQNNFFIITCKIFMHFSGWWIWIETFLSGWKKGEMCTKASVSIKVLLPHPSWLLLKAFSVSFSGCNILCRKIPPLVFWEYYKHKSLKTSTKVFFLCHNKVLCTSEILLGNLSVSNSRYFLYISM